MTVTLGSSEERFLEDSCGYAHLIEALRLTWKEPRATRKANGATNKLVNFWTSTTSNY